MSRTRRAGFTLIELLVVIAIIAVLISLLLPAVQAAREAARRSQCLNNLMQVAIALQNYESAHEVLPPGVIDPSDPVKNVASGFHQGWLIQVLPYIEQKNIYNHINLRMGVYDARNSTVRGVSVAVFHCASDPNGGGRGLAQSNYAACHNDVEAPIGSKNKGVMFLNSAVRYEDITDGSAQTIFVGEKLIDMTDFGWLSGTRATLRNTGSGVNVTPGNSAAGILLDDEELAAAKNLGEVGSNPIGGFSSRHSGGANFAFGDGSVHFLKGSISPRVYRALGNRADGEMLSADEF